MQYFHEEESTSYAYNVGAEFKDGKLLIHDWAMGDHVETRSDGDIEHYVIISQNNVYRFIRACCDEAQHKKPKKDISEKDALTTLNNIYKGDAQTIFKVQKILKENDIPYEFQVW